MILVPCSLFFVLSSFFVLFLFRFRICFVKSEAGEKMMMMMMMMKGREKKEERGTWNKERTCSSNHPSFTPPPAPVCS